jgi:hypothetical protein
VAVKGTAVDDEELAAGLVAIASPVRDEGREVVAPVNLAAHIDTMPRLGYRRADGVIELRSVARLPYVFVRNLREEWKAYVEFCMSFGYMSSFIYSVRRVAAVVDRERIY